MEEKITELEKLRDDLNTQLACVKETITLLDTKSVEKEDELKQKQKELDEVAEECVGRSILLYFGGLCISSIWLLLLLLFS